MASILAKLWSKLNTKRAPHSLMIVGLDNSGKTSILNYLMSSNLQIKHRRHQTRSSQQHQRTKQLPATNGELGEFDDSIEQLGADGTSFGHSSSEFDHNNEPHSMVVHPHHQNDCPSGSVSPTIGYNYEQIHYKNVALTILDFSGQSKYRSLWQEFYSSVDAIVFVIDSSDLIRFVVVRDELECLLGHPYFSTLELASSTNRALKMGTSLAAKLPIESSAVAALAPKQITVSQGKLVQSPLEPAPPNSKWNRHAQAHQQPLDAGAATCSVQRRLQVPILFLANKSDLANSVDTEVIVKALNLNQVARDKHPWNIKATSVNSRQGISEAFDWLIEQLVEK